MKVAELIVKQILDALDSGTVPWVRPWSCAGPYNFKSKREYSGINYILLASALNGPAFMTFKQIKELGGSVKKGASGLMVSYYGSHTKRGEDGEVVNAYRFLRYYKVFGQKDIEGIEFPELPEVDFNHESVNRILDTHRPEIEWGGDKAAYYPRLHKLSMPEKHTFNSEIDYYQTLMHELIHWTKGAGVDRSLGYAEEELVAEIGSCIVLQMIGLQPNIDNTTAYCNGWAGRIRGTTSSSILRASSLAYKAAHFLHAGSPPPA